MKHPLASISYLLFMVLFGLLLFPGSTLLLSTKYLLFLVALYFLFQNAVSEKTANPVKTYGWLFIGTTIVFLIYAAWYSGALFMNIVVYFFAASLLGFLLSAFISQKQALPRPVAKPVDKPAGKPATKVVKKVIVKSSRDDLSQIEGIGPQIRKLLEQNGIKTYDALSKAKVADLKVILENGGERFKLHNPGSWPRQAKLAKEGKWEALEKLQAELDAGLTTKTKRTKSKRAKKTAKKSTKKTAKKSAKKTTRKKASKKKTTKKSAKKKVAKKKPTRKKAAKKTAKKSTRKASKKAAKKTSKKSVKKSTRKKAAKKSTRKKASKKSAKKTAKKSSRKASKKSAKKSSKKSSRRRK